MRFFMDEEKCGNDSCAVAECVWRFGSSVHPHRVLVTREIMEGNTFDEVTPFNYCPKCGHGVKIGEVVNDSESQR
jgi:hypothetical protein